LLIRRRCSVLIAAHYSAGFESGKHHATTPYSIIVRIIKTVKPNCIAIRVASIALITEAQSLMPQAQGINAGMVWLILSKPIGNSMPIQKPSEAIAARQDGWGSRRH
jgi:hypothetical protein